MFGGIFIVRGRISKLYVIFLSAFCILGAHLFFIQIVNGEEYAMRAAQQSTETVVLEEVSRGDILDRNLISLTGGSINDFVIVFPKAIEDPVEIVSELASITGLDEETIGGYLDKGTCYIPYPLTPAQAGEIDSRNWQGVTVQSVKLRYGPRPLANHVLGYLGFPEDSTLQALAAGSDKHYRAGDLVGVHGLEKHYEDALKGTKAVGSVSAYFDAADKLIPGPSFALKDVAPDLGRQDLVLTIDSRIQGEVERIMDNTVQNGAVVVMDVHTGDILAMASRPNFDPSPGGAKPMGGDGALLDQCTSYYQPGSVFKIVIAAAAIEEGMVGSGSEFFCEGAEDDLISCWHKEGHGEINFAEAFANSCNPAFARIGLELGAERVIDYAQRFGLGESNITGYERQAPILGLEAIGEGYNLVNSSIGQWPVLATPVQVTAALNTLVNNGVYIEPRLVKALRYPGGGIAKYFPMGESRKVVSALTARQMREMMEMVTTDGVGKGAYIELFGSAGKTGSAQTEGENPRIDAWFTGYSPLDEPQYVVTVLIKDGVSGSVSAAPVFREIMENI
ncbi:MAG TPA: penicillin-binding protein 2, partial [Clostridia bacterium]|nr:penicillin-binding protein 2 [Clostridia bacterium]